MVNLNLNFNGKSLSIGHGAFKQVSFGALEFPGAHACPRQLDTGLKSGARASRATIREYELRGARREFVFNFCAGLRGARRDVFFDFGAGRGGLNLGSGSNFGATWRAQGGPWQI